MDNSKKFRYRLDRRAKIITTLGLLLIAGGVAFLFYESGGTYLPAWFATLVAALMLLAALSIPRFVLVSPHSIEIHCVLQLVKIPIRSIRAIRFLELQDMRPCMPLWGIYGVFGYYGYFYNPKLGRLVRLYISRWRNFVLVEDNHARTYIIGAENPTELVAQIEKYR